MRFNHVTSTDGPSDCIYDNVHNNMPIVGYGSSEYMPQTHSIVNNMMYYQGIYYPIPNWLNIINSGTINYNNKNNKIWFLIIVNIYNIKSKYKNIDSDNLLCLVRKSILYSHLVFTYLKE